MMSYSLSVLSQYSPHRPFSRHSSGVAKGVSPLQLQPRLPRDVINSQPRPGRTEGRARRVQGLPVVPTDRLGSDVCPLGALCLDRLRRQAAQSFAAGPLRCLWAGRCLQVRCMSSPELGCASRPIEGRAICCTNIACGRAITLQPQLEVGGSQDRHISTAALSEEHSTLG
eukprot:4919216-Pleurochrysis_carterae.AAC.2